MTPTREKWVHNDPDLGFIMTPTRKWFFGFFLKWLHNDPDKRKMGS
jgi:hypothetical protein